MEDYFATLLSNSSTNDLMTNDSSNDSSVDVSSVSVDDLTNSTINDLNVTVETETSTDEKVVKGSSNKKKITIIYSFIKSVFSNLTSLNIKILNLEKKLDEIVKSVHDNLENTFTTASFISNKIVDELNKYIISVSDEYDYIYLPYTLNSSPYSIHSFFKSLVSSSSLSFTYKLIFINPDQELILKEITDYYLSNHLRYTLNRLIIHIIKNYSESKQSVANSIQFFKQPIDEAFKSISSAFTDKDDKQKIIDQFFNKLNPSNPPTNYIIHSMLLLPLDNISVLNLSIKDVDKPIDLNKFTPQIVKS